MKTQRKEEVVVLNIFYCLLIIFIHSSSDMISYGARESLTYLLVLGLWRLSFFAIQGFIFLSAYKSVLIPGEFHYGSYLKKRVRVIFLPYVLWNVIYYLNFVFWGYFPFSLGDLLYYIAAGTLSAPFYFVIVIMQFYLLMPVWRWLVNHVKPWLGISLGILLQYSFRPLLYPMYAAILPNHTIFFHRLFPYFLLVWLVGLYCGKYRDWFLAYLPKVRLAIGLGFALFSGSTLFFVTQDYIKGVSWEFSSVNYQIYTLFTIFFSLLLAQKVKVTPLMEKIGGVTYPIYLNHCFILFYVSKVLERIPLPSTLAYLIRVLLMYLLTVGGNLLLKEVFLKGKRLYLNKGNL